MLSWLGFGFGGGYLLSHRLPTILARRRAQEREANPEAFAKAESRRRWRSLGVLGLAIAAFFAAFALIVYRV